MKIYGLGDYEGTQYMKIWYKDRNYKYKKELLEVLKKTVHLDYTVAEEDVDFLLNVDISVVKGDKISQEQVDVITDRIEELESDISTIEEVAEIIESRYKNKTSNDEIIKAKVNDFTSASACYISDYENENDYLVFRFKHKDVVKNFNPGRVTIMHTPGYSNDLETMTDNVKQVMQTLYQAGFLTNGVELKFGGGGRSFLHVTISV